MQFDNRIGKVIQEASNRIRHDVALLDETGDVLFASDKHNFGVRDEFLDEVNFVQDIGHAASIKRTYMQLFGDNHRPLFLAMEGENESVDQFIYLLAGTLQEILRTGAQKPGLEEVYRRIMLDQIDPLELQEVIHDFKIEVYLPRCVMLVQTLDTEAGDVYNILNQIFSKKAGDIVVSVNRYVVAVVKVMEEKNTIEEAVQLTRAIDETIAAELTIRVAIGVGNVQPDILAVHESFHEAQDAISLGLVRHGSTDEHIFLFQRLLLERFFQVVPREVRKQFYEMVHTRALNDLLTEEMLETVERLFECNLNLSETSRKQYIHRNTLIYRLDKIQRTTGMDLRTFDDAVLLKMILMIGQSLKVNSRGDK